jgi:hypothetical protein
MALSAQVLGDAHPGPAAPQVVTMNLCTLNEGNDLSDVVKFQKRWLEWNQSKDISLFNEVLIPVVGRGGPGESNLDFIELSVSSYDMAGRFWGDWNETKKGQAMAEEWGDLADCAIRISDLVMKYQDSAAGRADTERVVSFTRCEIHDGVTGNEMRAAHQRALDARSADATNLAWGLLLPRAGGQDARNVFRHAMVFPDMQAWAAHLAQQAARQPALRDYNHKYARCDQPTIWMSQVLAFEEES